MRTGSLLCSLTTQGMEPLGAFNQPVYRSYGQIRAALLNELGKPFADYFARPDSDAEGTRISWFAHELGDLRRWIDLPPEEQARLDPARQRIQDGFTQYRAQLEAAPLNSPRSNFAKLLAQASCVPGPQYLYFLGDQPVIAFWGFKTTGMPEGLDPLRLVPGSVILGGGGERGGASTVVIPPTPVRRRWWLWLLWLGALLLLLALLLGLWAWWTDRPIELGPLGLKPPIARLETPPIGPIRSEETHRPDLVPPNLVPPNLVPPVTGNRVIVPRDEPHRPTGGVTDHETPHDHVVPPAVAPGLDDNLDQRSPLVPPTISPPPVPSDQPVAPPGPPDLPPADTQAEPEKPPLPSDQPTVPPGPPDLPPADTQAEPRPSPVPSDQPAIPPGLPDLPPAGVQGARGPPLALPKDARPGPADFMQGTWRSRSGLMLNGKPAEEFYRFDKSGQGDVTLRTRDGSIQCSGPAQAAVGSDRRLSVEEAPQLNCSDGSSVAGAVTECRPGAARTACQGTNRSDGSQFGVHIEGMQKP